MAIMRQQQQRKKIRLEKWKIKLDHKQTELNKKIPLIVK